ncbi:MAG: glycosyltransferase family 39 protein [Anaerolineales bacterium]|nr:MAG: glycosyltransferase family 39 protein [Anaerolineales bacterium]
MRARFELLVLAPVILLIAFTLRVYRLDVQSIWWDEGHSIGMASAPVAQIPNLPGMDVHPPGYFVLLHQWMALVGRSEFALRYLSVAFSLLTVALLIRFGQALVGLPADQSCSRVALVTGGLAALSPLYVAYAQEVRMYAVVTFFALASVYFQWLVLHKPPAEGLRTWAFAGYVLATAAGLYTHYFTIFLLLFQNLVWLIWALILRPPKGLGPGRVMLWLSSQLAVLLLLSPQLPLAWQQTVAYANPNLNPPGVAEFLRRSWLAYTVGTAVEPVVAGRLAWGAVAVLGLGMLFRIVMARLGAWADQLGRLAFLGGWLFAPLATYFLVLQRRPSFEPRYMMLVTPALMLLLAWVLTGNSCRWTWWGGLGASLALGIFAWGTWSYFTNVEAYKDDSAGVTAWLAAETHPNDVVYVDVPHPFHYYAERIPAPTRYLFVDVHTAAEILNAEAAGRERLFWVTWRGSDTDPRGVIPFLLDKTGRRAGELDFRGYHVAWWDLPGGAHFSLPDDLSQSAGCHITFGELIQLDGLDFSDAAQVGGMAWATLHFTLLRNTDVDYRVSLRLRDPQGDMLPPTDKDLLNDRHFRTSAWPQDDPRLNQAINVYSLPIPPGTMPGIYSLEAVVYEAITLAGLPVTGGCISPAGDGASVQLGSVTVSP